MLSLLFLYIAVTGSSQSVAGVASTALTFEPTRPATWQELVQAGSVLQGRLRAWFPHSSGLLGWTPQSGRLVMLLPPDVPEQWLVSEATRIGKVEVVEGGTEFLPIGRHVGTGAAPRPELGVYESVLSAAHFITADAYLRHGQAAIEFVLTPEGDERLLAHTDRQRGYYLCLLVDGVVVNCPILRTPLTGRHGFVELTGGATLDQARTLAMLLRSGPLPVAFRPVGLE